eukprot:gene55179-62866_t
MARRVFADNGQATVHLAHLVQYAGMMKADADLQKTRQARRAVVRNSVMYVTEETWDEWAETHIDQLIAFEVPMVSLRKVPASVDHGGIDPTQLRKMVEQDAAAGAVPSCVVGRIGSEGYHAGDNLGALMQVCAQHKLWLHVEGPAVFFVASQWQQYDCLRKVVQDNILNFSIAVCEDEVPGLRKLPGFWMFCSGRDCGGRQLPQDVNAEVDLTSAKYCLPSYLRLRTGGTDPVHAEVQARFADAERLRTPHRQ